MIDQALSSFGRPGRGQRTLALLLVVFAACGLAVALRPGLTLALLVAVGFGVVLVTDTWLAFVFGGAFLVFQHLVLAWLEPASLAARLTGHADDLLLVVLALGAAAAKVSRADPLRVPREIVSATLLGAAALLVGLGGALLHGASSLVIGLDAFALGKGFLVLAATSLLPNPTFRIGPLLRLGTVASVALALFGLLDLVAPALTHGAIPLAGPLAYRGDRRCLVSVLANEGMAGWFFAAAACLPLARYIVRRSRADLVAGVLLTLASFLSLRRKPVVGLAFAVAVVLLLQTGPGARRRLVVAAALVALVAFPVVGSAISASFHDAWLGYVVTPDPMDVARNALYIGGWQIALDYFPLGAGLGLFGGFASAVDYSDFYNRYGLSRVWGLTPAAPDFVSDAQYPHLLGALGLLGTTLFLLALGRVLLSLARVARFANDETLRTLATAALLVGLESLVEAVAAPVWETALPCLVVFGLAGVTLAAAPRPPA